MPDGQIWWLRRLPLSLCTFLIGLSLSLSLFYLTLLYRFLPFDINVSDAASFDCGAGDNLKRAISIIDCELFIFDQGGQFCPLIYSVFLLG
jgi:hypothetical protein